MSFARTVSSHGFLLVCGFVDVGIDLPRLRKIFHNVYCLLPNCTRKAMPHLMSLACTVPYHGGSRSKQKAIAGFALFSHRRTGCSEDRTVVASGLEMRMAKTEAYSSCNLHHGTQFSEGSPYRVCLQRGCAVEIDDVHLRCYSAQGTSPRCEASRSHIHIEENLLENLVALTKPDRAFLD